jgi:hypothetical protein
MSDTHIEALHALGQRFRAKLPWLPDRINSLLGRLVLADREGRFDEFFPVYRTDMQRALTLAIAEVAFDDLPAALRSEVEEIVAASRQPHDHLEEAEIGKRLDAVQPKLLAALEDARKMEVAVSAAGHRRARS